MKDFQQDLPVNNKGLNANVEESARLLLRRIFRILHGCGIDSEKLRNINLTALEKAFEDPDSRPNFVTHRQVRVCSDVVLKWRRHPAFLNSEGLPARLFLDAKSPSFVELVETAAPGADWKELVASMIELGVVRVVANSRIDLLSESVVGCSGRDGSLVASEFVLEHISGFLGSVEYNVFEKPSREKGRFERACYALVPEDVVPVLENLISARGQDFVDVVDEWLARRASDATSKSRSVLVGAGAYVFVRTDMQQKY